MVNKTAAASFSRWLSPETQEKICLASPSPPRDRGADATLSVRSRSDRRSDRIRPDPTPVSAGAAFLVSRDG
jgi:hypothetical protein